MEETKLEEHFAVENDEIKEEVREEYEELRQSINKLSHNITHIFSYWQIWLRGIVQGVGIAIGSGIVFVLLSAILYQLLSYLGFGSEVRDLLPVKQLPGNALIEVQDK